LDEDLFFLRRLVAVEFRLLGLLAIQGITVTGFVVRVDDQKGRCACAVDELSLSNKMAGIAIKARLKFGHVLFDQVQWLAEV